MRNSIILVYTLFSMACAQASLQTQNGQPLEQKTPSSNVGDLKPSANFFPMPNLEFIGEASVWRISEVADRYGRNMPPWTEVRLASSFETEKDVGDRITVIPLAVDIIPFQWRVRRAENERRGEQRQALFGWKVEPFSQQEFFDIEPLADRAQEFPFDVVILYPAVEFAREIGKERLSLHALPKGTSLDSVKTAVDLTNDHLPDVLIFEFCCDQRKTICDYVCGKIFVKANNRWKLVDEFSPL